MHELDDNALLREFAGHGSEPAFAELVARHINKVYSVALRHTRNPHQAEEITQAVFVILARKAKTLGQNVILSGWLYQTARLTAVTIIRGNIRRAQREQEVLMQNLNDDSAADPWPQIAPLLDDALAGLSETDRHAVVLRYFDGKSLKEVGAALGGSEDAAKMRVNRAVEKLRTFFTKRGVTLSAAGLSAAIAANSVQSAPLGLAAAVTTTALSGTALTTSVILAATKTIAMTTLQKTLITVTIAALAGAGIYQTRKAAQLLEQNQTLQNQLYPLEEQLQQVQRERDKATNNLAVMAEEFAKTKKNNFELLKLRGEVGQLRHQLTEAQTKKTQSPTNSFKQAMSAPHPPGAFISVDQFVFAGYATPEAAFESVNWALFHGSQEQVLESVTPSAAHFMEQSRLENGQPTNHEEDQAKKAEYYKGIQILAVKSLSDNMAELKVRQSFNSQPPQILVETMYKVRDLWKWGGMIQPCMPGWETNGQVQVYAQ